METKTILLYQADRLALRVSLKWPLEEVQFFQLLHWLHFSALVIAVWLVSDDEVT